MKGGPGRFPTRLAIVALAATVLIVSVSAWMLAGSRAQDTTPAEAIAPQPKDTAPAEAIAPPAKDIPPAEAIAPPAKDTAPTEAIAPQAQDTTAVEGMTPQAQDTTMGAPTNPPPEALPFPEAPPCDPADYYKPHDGSIPPGPAFIPADLLGPDSAAIPTGVPVCKSPPGIPLNIPVPPGAVGK